jgi:hypothetical protein
MTAMVAKRTIYCDKYESKLGQLCRKSDVYTKPLKRCVFLAPMNIVANVHSVRIADGSFKFFAIHFVILIWMK